MPIDGDPAYLFNFSSEFYVFFRCLPFSYVVKSEQLYKVRRIHDEIVFKSYLKPFCVR